MFKQKPRVISEPALEELIGRIQKPASQQPASCKIKAFPFDPIERAEEVEKVVMQGNKRLYYKFRYQDYYNGVATADTIGCNILCAYCWNYSRNQDPTATNGAVYKTPGEVAKRLDGICEKKKINTVRISGAEPFLGEASAKHMAEVLKLCEGREFIIETNGLMLGYMPALIDLIKPYKPYVRLTIKGDSDKQFEKVTGAKGEYFDLQLKAYHGLKSKHLETGVAAMPEFCNISRMGMVLKTHVEEEGMRYYAMTKRILESRGLLDKGVLEKRQATKFIRSPMRKNRRGMSH